MSPEKPRIPTQPGVLSHLGEQLRAARKAQKVSASTAAEAAGISRVTLHRIERGEGGVAVGSWAAAAEALGMTLELREPGTGVPSSLPEGEKIALAEYPELKRLAWQLHATAEVTPQEALGLYERNWRHLNRAQLTMKEVALIHALGNVLGGGRLLV
jgi:transcriptional regulator with XRE-family HTH domain